MKKSLLIVAMALTSMAGLAQQKSVNVATAGQLSSLIGASEKYAITDLTVTGELNGADIAFIRDMAGKDEEGETTEGQLQKLDMKGAKIVSGGVYYTNMRTTQEYEAEADVVGEMMFSSLKLTDVVLPQELSRMDYRAFYECKELASIEGTESVGEYGKAVFESCSKLAKVMLPPTMTVVPEAMFSRCSVLDGVELPAGLTTVEADAFYGCGLTSITLPQSLENIGNDAFGYTDITTLVLPASVRTLGDGAFSGCKQLADLTLNEGLVTIGERAFNSVGAEKITVPSTVTSIGSSAFGTCANLTEVVLPEGLTTLADYLFDRCDNLTTVNIPSTVTLIDECAFQNCYALLDVTLPEGLETIGERAFSSCEALTSFAAPSTLKSIGPSAFEWCSGLQTVTLNDGLETIGAGAFQSTPITEITIPEGITELGVGDGSMWGPSGMVFMGCDQLATVHLPSTITSLGRGSFIGCPLEQLTIDAIVPPTIESRSNPFDGECYETCQLNVPEGSVDAYKEAAVWSNFTNITASTTTGVKSIDNVQVKADNRVYNLGGQRKVAGSKGLTLSRNKKYIR